MPPCRSCGGKNLQLIISFGRTPLADALVWKENLGKPEIFAQLDLVFCPDCTLVQITESVDPGDPLLPGLPVFLLRLQVAPAALP